MCKNKCKSIASLFAIACLLISQSYAQEIIPPEPISMAGRFTPAFGSESIVKIRFTVKADGTVDDLELDDLLLANNFIRNMLRSTVNDWTFKPATVAGEAVNYYNQEYTFALRMDPNAPAPEFGPGGNNRARTTEDVDDINAVPQFNPATVEPPQLALSPDIKEAFEEIAAMISNGDGDKALKEIRNRLRRDANTVFDYALLQELKINVLMSQADMHAALEAAILATMTAINNREEEYYFLLDDVLETALRKKMVLAATLRQHALAISTYEELKGRFDISDDEQLANIATTAQDALDSPEPLPLLAKIIEDEWTLVPSRRIFTVSNVSGRLNKIELRCERRTLELDYEDNVDWTMPDSFGDCKLAFRGRDDTTFVVYQFAE